MFGSNYRLVNKYMPAVFAAIMLGWLLYLLVLSPRAGLPDNGDATRIFNRHDLLKNDSLNTARGYSPYLVTQYRYLVPYFDRSLTFYLPNVNDPIILVARSLQYFSGQGGFDVVWLALLLIGLYTYAWLLLCRQLAARLPSVVFYAIASLSLLLLSDVLFTAYFNSFLQDFALFPILLLFVASYIMDNRYSLVALFCFLLFCALKEQYMPFVLLLPLLFPLVTLRKLGMKAVLVGILALPFFVTTMLNMRHFANTHNTNRLYLGILQTDSRNIREAIQYFGLTKGHLALAEKLKTSNRQSGLACPKLTDVLGYWVSHPLLVMHAYCKACVLVCYNPPYPPHKVGFTRADTLVGQTDKLLLYPWFWLSGLLPVWVGFLLFASLSCFRKRLLGKASRLLVFLLIAILLSPLIAFIGDGFNELPRHCVAVYFYATLSVGVWGLAKYRSAEKG